MTCREARNLFDAHLDGELSMPLETELGAHLVECPTCRRELALLEVTGHVIGTDVQSREISDSFADRLLACMEEPPTRSVLQLRGVVKWSVGFLAAAASLAVAIGWLTARPHYVAGTKEKVMDSVPAGDRVSSEAEQVGSRTSADLMEPWLSHSSPAPKPELNMSDWSKLTIMQLLDSLGFKENAESGKSEPGDTATESNNLEPQSKSEDPQIEDL